MPGSTPVERRCFEFRVADGGAELPVLEGIALPYGQRAEIGPFSEEFRAGGLEAGDVIANVLHDDRQLLARTGGGLTLTDGPDAMRARIELPDTTAGRDAAQLVRSRVLRGFSVEFRAIEEDWQGTHRTVLRARMTGIGVVHRPAYSGAVLVEGRSIDTADWMATRGGLLRKVRRWRSL